MTIPQSSPQREMPVCRSLGVMPPIPESWLISSYFRFFEHSGTVVTDGVTLLEGSRYDPTEKKNLNILVDFFFISLIAIYCKENANSLT